MANDQLDSSTTSPSSEDTTVANSSTTPQTDAGHVEGQESISAAPPSGTEGNGSQDDLAKRREEGKLRQEQQARRQLEQEYQETSERLRNITEWATKNPARYREALIETSGLSEAEADAEVAKLHPDWQSVPNAPVRPIAPALTPSQSAALSQIEMKEKEKSLARTKAANQFYTDHPDVDNLTRYSIATEASRLENLGMNPDEAMKKAATKILDEDSIRQEGVIEGMGKALSGVQPTASKAGGGAPATTGAEVTSLDTEVMKKLGIKSDDAKKVFMEHKVNS